MNIEASIGRATVRSKVMPHSYPNARQRQAGNQFSGQIPGARGAELLPGTGSPGAVTVTLPSGCSRPAVLATNVAPRPAPREDEQVRVSRRWLGTALPQSQPGLTTPRNWTLRRNASVIVTVSALARPVLLALIPIESCRCRSG